MYELMTPTRKNLLPALALCWKCGSDVATGDTRHGKRVYVCRANKCISRKAEPVDKPIEAVVARLSRSDAMGLLSRPDTPDLAVQQNKAQAIRDRLDDLATGLEEGVLTLVSVRRSSDRLGAELAVIEAKMRDATHADVLTPLVTAGDVAAAWDKCDLQQKRAVSEALMIVTLSGPKRGRQQFDAETVKIDWRSAHV